MMTNQTKDNIKEQLIDIAYDILRITREDNVVDINEERKLLHLIMAESNKSLEFVALIEDEFDIEFEDEDVNLDFFQNFNYIAYIIKKYIA